jgi:hypothetical protein
MKTMTLHEIAAECDRIAAANGFDQPTWDNLIVKLALAITELNEARDGVVGKGSDPIQEELADCAIRLLSILHAIWPEQWSERPLTGPVIGTFAPIEVLLWPIVDHVCQAMETRRHDDRADTLVCIEYALKETRRLSVALGIDLTTEILIKCAKNAKRGHLHGKAYAGG